jgi:tetratricopeptide (TPR) repeat protein
VDQKHPTSQELESAVLGGLSAGQARTVVLHLLRGCLTCNLALLPYIPQRLLPASRREALPSPPLDAYDAPIDRALAAVGLRTSRRDAGGSRKRQALAVLALGGLDALAAAPPGLKGMPLFEALLERSWVLRHHDPRQMVKLAQAATILADHLDARTIGPLALADLRFRAWTELANAHRAADELDLAEHALAYATDHFRLGLSDELLLARFLVVFASHQAARRNFDLACTTLDVVVTLYLRHENGHLAGRALIMRGIFTGYSGQAEEAVENFDRGLAMIDEERDPGLVVSSLQNRAWFLVDCGRFRDAHRTLFDLRRRGLDVGGRLGELKLRWLEGHIHAGLGKFDLAERALGQVKAGFEEAGLGYKAALAGLELAEVWLRQRRVQEAESLALQCADAFIALRVRRELMAAVLVVHQAAETHYLDLAVLRHAIHVLHKEDRDPTASPLAEP